MNATLDKLMRFSKPAQPRIAVKNTTIVTVDPQVGVLYGADIVIEGSTIVAMGPQAAANISDTEAIVVDGKGYVVSPGFEASRDTLLGRMRDRAASKEKDR